MPLVEVPYNSRSNCTVVVTFQISGILQGDALQIGILLEEHPVFSISRVRGIVGPFILIKLAILLTVRRDRGRFIAKVHSKGIKMKLVEVVHVVIEREWKWLHQSEQTFAIDYLCSAMKDTSTRLPKSISWGVKKKEVASSHGKRTNV
jgi:hypothetical protein